MKNIIAIISIFMVVFACGNETKTDQLQPMQLSENTIALSNEQFKNAGIETVKMSVKSISSLLKVKGKVEVPPQSRVSITAPMGGYLKSTHLLAGKLINKGEILAVLEDVQYIQLQQDYLTAKAQLSLTESEYLRQKTLNQSKATSDKVFENANANYQTQLIVVKSLEQKLQLIGLNPLNISTDNISRSINIYSPVSGIVSAVNVNIGKYVNPTDGLFELINTDNMHLSLSVFEKDIDNLSVGQSLMAFTNAKPNTKYPCKIMLINKSTSSQNSFEILCRFDRHDESLIPGMFMNAEIDLHTVATTSLPSNAIVRFENNHYVFIAKNNNQYEMIEVMTGSSENGYTEVLNANDLAQQIFVAKGAYNLLMALKNKSDE